MNPHYRRAMEHISLSPEAKAHIKARLTQPERRRIAPRRWAAVAAAAVLACALTITANAEGIQAFFHSFDSSVAESLAPVGRSCTDQGLTLTVQSATVEGNKLVAYLLVQNDGNSGVMREEVSGWKKFEVVPNYKPSVPNYMYVGMNSRWEPLGYDAESGSYGILLTIQQKDELSRPVVYEKASFKLSVKRMIVDQTHTSIRPEIDWQSLPNEPETMSVIPFSWVGIHSYPHTVLDGRSVVLTPGDEMIHAADGYAITAMGVLENGLHIQLRHQSDSPDDTEILIFQTRCPDGRYSTADYCTVRFRDEDGVEYIEYIFDVSPSQLEGGSLVGGFSTGGKRVDGKWTVTFNLDEQDETAKQG